MKYMPWEFCGIPPTLADGRATVAVKRTDAIASVIIEAQTPETLATAFEEYGRSSISCAVRLDQKIPEELRALTRGSRPGWYKFVGGMPSKNQTPLSADLDLALEEGHDFARVRVECTREYSILPDVEDLYAFTARAAATLPRESLIGLYTRTHYCDHLMHCDNTTMEHALLQDSTVGVLVGRLNTDIVVNPIGNAVAMVNDPRGYFPKQGSRVNCALRPFVRVYADGAAHVHLALVATTRIKEGAELFLDYGQSEYWGGWQQCVALRKQRWLSDLGLEEHEQGHEHEGEGEEDLTLTATVTVTQPEPEPELELPPLPIPDPLSELEYEQEPDQEEPLSEQNQVQPEPQTVAQEPLAQIAPPEPQTVAQEPLAQTAPPEPQTVAQEPLAQTAPPEPQTSSEANRKRKRDTDNICDDYVHKYLRRWFDMYDAPNLDEDANHCRMLMKDFATSFVLRKETVLRGIAGYDELYENDHSLWYPIHALHELGPDALYALHPTAAFACDMMIALRTVPFVNIEWHEDCEYETCEVFDNTTFRISSNGIIMIGSRGIRLSDEQVDELSKVVTCIYNDVISLADRLVAYASGPNLIAALIKSDGKPTRSVFRQYEFSDNARAMSRLAKECLEFFSGKHKVCTMQFKGDYSNNTLQLTLTDVA